MSDENNTSIFSKADISPTPTTFDHEVPAQEDPDQGQQPQPELTRDSIYYFDPVVFKIDGVLFKVPKHGFMVPGSMFYDMFSLPIPEGQEAEGSNSNPITPSSVTQEEFAGFLSMMYPYLGRSRPVYSFKGLAGALKLSTMWQYEKIRIGTIHFLLPTNFKLIKLVPNRLLQRAKNHVLLAQKYESKTLLREGLLTLISGNVTVELLRCPSKLDWETISRIFAAKTRLMEENRSFELRNLDESLIRRCVDVMFEKELRRMAYISELGPHSEVDADYLGLFERWVSMRVYGDQTASESEPEVPQETQTGLFENSASATDRPHDIYYIETFEVTVENTLFSLPKVDFLHISDHIPPHISALSFHHFLSAFYSIDGSQMCDYDQWLDVLDLSTFWGLTEIRQRAIRMMYPLIKERNLVETVLLARKYKVKAWMIGALEGLANRRANPNMIQELREPFELDWITIAKLLSIQCQSIAIPTHLQRPDFCCRSCHWRKQNVRQPGPCAHTCTSLSLPTGDEEYIRFMEGRDAEWTWSSDLESSEDLASSNNAIRERILTEFREEIMDWPYQ